MGQQRQGYHKKNGENQGLLSFKLDGKLILHSHLTKQRSLGEFLLFCVTLRTLLLIPSDILSLTQVKHFSVWSYYCNKTLPTSEQFNVS